MASTPAKRLGHCCLQLATHSGAATTCTCTQCPEHAASEGPEPSRESAPHLGPLGVEQLGAVLQAQHRLQLARLHLLGKGLHNGAANAPPAARVLGRTLQRARVCVVLLRDNSGFFCFGLKGSPRWSSRRTAPRALQRARVRVVFLRSILLLPHFPYDMTEAATHPIKTTDVRNAVGRRRQC